MRRIGLILLAFAVVFAGIAAWGLRTGGRAHASAATPAAKAAVADVVVAARPIPFGQTLSPVDLKLQPWPAAAVPTGAFRSVAQVTSGASRRAIGPIAAGEVILPDRITGPGGRAGLSRLIRPGMLAASVRVDDALGVAGFVLPGEQVDVLVTRNDAAQAGGRGTARTDVLLQDVRVLAVDQQSDPSKDRPVLARTATLELTPVDAQKLALASQVGVISLALRSAEAPATDTAVYRTVGATALGGPRVQPVPAHARHARAGASGPVMEVYRGIDVSRVPVASG